MTSTGPVAAHYEREGLLAAFEAGVAALGKSPETVSIDDLAPADEFHIGGREASVEFLDQVGLAAGRRVLDVGCGLGGALAYPLPWATTAATCAVATPDAYREALEAAGFVLLAERARRQFALDFFARLRARLASSKGPPPLGLHLVMGADTPTKIGNMVANIEAGLIAPVEMIARRR